MKRLLAIAAVLLLGVALLFLAGSLRYGGPDGLLLRARAEIAARQASDHPVLVPTPLPTPTASPPPRLPAPAPSATPRAGVYRPAVFPSPSAAPSTATPTPTPTFTATPTPTLSPSPTATPPALADGAYVELTGLAHQWQTWNNCGPATLSTYLSYFGSTLNQEAVRRALRPNGEDKNVNPDEMAAFARSQGYRALVRVNGDADRLRALLQAGVPVLIETWLELEPNDGMGHYRLLTGYDDARQEWIVYDSYVSNGLKKDAPYRGIRAPYAEIADLWRLFNRTYVVIYTDDLAPTVEGILGPEVDDAAMWERALAQAQAERTQAPADAFAWFNEGSALVALGRHAEAAAAL